MATKYLATKGVALISLVNPPSNFISSKLRKSLLQDLKKAVQEKVPAVVLIGNGINFSCGIDIKDVFKKDHLVQPTLSEITEYMDTLTIPLVACLHGSTLNGGLETALACHWRVSTKSTVLGIPEVNVGIIPGLFIYATLVYFPG